MLDFMFYIFRCTIFVKHKYFQIHVKHMLLFFFPAARVLPRALLRAKRRLSHSFLHLARCYRLCSWRC